LLNNLVEASFDLFKYLLRGNQLKPWHAFRYVHIIKMSQHAYMKHNTTLVNYANILQRI